MALNREHCVCLTGKRICLDLQHRLVLWPIQVTAGSGHELGQSGKFDVTLTRGLLLLMRVSMSRQLDVTVICGGCSGSIGSRV